MPTITLTIPACDGCCGITCPCKLAATVNATFSGVTFCAGPIVVGTNGSGQVVSVAITAWNDPNVLTPVTWDNVANCETGSAVANLGSLNFDTYLDGVFNSSEFAANGVQLDLSCTAAGMTAAIVLGLQVGPDAFNGIAFNAGNFPLSTPTGNTLGACGDSFGGGTFTVFGITGSVIVEI